MRGLLKIWFRLADWKVEEGLRLAESSGATGRGTVPWAEWVSLSPSSEGASADAFCRFVEYDLPEHPSLDHFNMARARFTATERDA
jgi:hypothetical protein